MVYNYHSKQLDLIKKVTGASFLGYVREGDKFQLKYIKNGNTTYFKLEGFPSDVTPAKYNKLLNTILEHNGRETNA